MCVDILKFAELIGQCQSLRSLNIYAGFSIRPSTYEKMLTLIADGCPSLQHIHLGNVGIIVEGMQKLLERKRQHLLSLTCKIFMTKDIAEHISECTKLQHLEIGNFNDDLSYDDIKSLLKITHLKYFAFQSCSEDVVNSLPLL
jgi:hypothetical protein